MRRVFFSIALVMAPIAAVAWVYDFWASWHEGAPLPTITAIAATFFLARCLLQDMSAWWRDVR